MKSRINYLHLFEKQLKYTTHIKGKIKHTVISGSLSPVYGASSGYGWRNGLQYGG
jgi:hypothetical protein